ncbi:nucleotidyltransferase family protein [Polaribacter sp. MSW13]|uniref:Nucleotidyltransferase family protein n=1 Tax=Polaribacter marinus TaxID=2916838 RepID=A0A9X1VQ49_9FLAO|nr:nucleotidyltransferase family protein [Polaribacter marinus]MCI2230225.1 nucleotidyltransferase family protein [Polaribacter marinus]
MNSIAILVLAAGKSSRMKEIKQLLKINNKTLLEITLENAQKVTPKNIFCVLGANASKIKANTASKNIKYLLNKNFEDGLSSSLVCGVAYIQKNHPEFNAVLILLADQPDVDDVYLNEIIKISLENPTKIISTSYSKNAGVPAIFPAIYFEKLLTIKGDKGAKDFLQKDQFQVIKIKRKKPFLDIDTQEDYILYKKFI